MARTKSIMLRTLAIVFLFLGGSNDPRFLALGEEETVDPSMMLDAAGVTVATAKLFKAVKMNSPENIRIAVDKLGAQLNAQAGGKQTALMQAVILNKIEAVKALLEFPSIDVTIPEENGYTLIHAAAMQGNAEIVKILAAHENADGEKLIDIQVPHTDGYYPIHRACGGKAGEDGKNQNYIDTVEAFIDLGVPYDIPAVEPNEGRVCMQLGQTREMMATLLAAQVRPMLQRIQDERNAKAAAEAAVGGDEEAADDEL